MSQWKGTLLFFLLFCQLFPAASRLVLTLSCCQLWDCAQWCTAFCFLQLTDMPMHSPELVRIRRTSCPRKNNHPQITKWWQDYSDCRFKSLLVETLRRDTMSSNNALHFKQSIFRPLIVTSDQLWSPLFQGSSGATFQPPTLPQPSLP